MGSIPGLGRFHTPRRLSLRAIDPMLHSKRSHCSEKPKHRILDSSPCSPQLEKACEPQSNQKINKQNVKKILWKKKKAAACSYWCTSAFRGHRGNWLQWEIPATTLFLRKHMRFLVVLWVTVYQNIFPVSNKANKNKRMTEKRSLSLGTSLVVRWKNSMPPLQGA